MEPQSMRNSMHLATQIAARSERKPNFALLIGAGASATSGVKTASEMVRDWRVQLYEQVSPGAPFDEWVETQPWYESEEEYPILFEQLYDAPMQRRNYIEECVKNARPSWGYIYLANLIKHDYFNVVFTPNFDDLLNESCCAYAELKPLVCAHDSAVSGIRVTSARPKIIKLHGDFLYDSIKNTIAETSQLENNMREKLGQFLLEYGLVVIGYGGSDRSIMETLDMLLRKDNTLPGGLYWCKRPTDRTSPKLDRLLRHQKAYLVEIEGFDEFTASLHDHIALELPDAIADPYRATTTRLNSFVDVRRNPSHPVIVRDLEKLATRVREFEARSKELEPLVPYAFLGWRGLGSHDYRQAQGYFEKAVKLEPEDPEALLGLGFARRGCGESAKAMEVADETVRRWPQRYEGHVLRGGLLGDAGQLPEAIVEARQAFVLTEPGSPERLLAAAFLTNALLRAGEAPDALVVTEPYFTGSPGPASNGLSEQILALNRAMALALVGTERDSEREALIESVLRKPASRYVAACAFAALGKKEEMLKALREAVKDDSAVRIDARTDPDFKAYHDDPEFLKILNT